MKPQDRESLDAFLLAQLDRVVTSVLPPTGQVAPVKAVPHAIGTRKPSLGQQELEEMR